MSRLREVVVLLLLLPATVLAQSVLIHVSAEGSAPEVRIQTQTRIDTTSVQPATVSPVITVLIDGAALATGSLNASLVKLAVPRRRTAMELIALLPGDQMRTATAATRLQLTAAIRSLAASAGHEPQPASFAALLQSLRSLPTDRWKQVIYIGNEPAIAPDLRDYAYGVLLRTLAGGRIRLSHAYPGDAGEPAWAPYLRSFGGSVSPEGPASLVETGEARWVEAKMPTEGPAEGFQVLPLRFRIGDGDLRTVPWIWSAPGTILPSLSQYEAFLIRRASITHSTATAADLQRLLAINPSDLETLKLAADFAERTSDIAAAVRYGGRIVQLEPENGLYWGRLGIGYWRIGDRDNAERCIIRARKQGADPPQSAAILGDIRFGKKDYSGAVGHYREALNREPNRVELWLKLADSEQSLSRKPEAAQALEEALKRKPDLWPRRTQIIDYYLEAANTAGARRHIYAAIVLLPPDTPLVIRFATYCERLGQVQDARKLWTRAIELDPTNELAHYSLARGYQASGTWDKALEAAENGARVAPQSVRLLALQTDAMVALARMEDARRLLKSVTGRLPDPELLRRSADLEDRYGIDSPKYYRTLVESMRTTQRPEGTWHPYAVRGLEASIREGETESCEWFSTILHSTLCAPETPPPDAPSIVVRGGLRPLLFMAHGPEESSADAFLSDYSRTLSANIHDRSRTNNAAADAYRDRLVEYFHLLADLEAMGKGSAGKIAVRLSLENQKSSRLTERVLALLGWRVRHESGKVVVEPAIKGKRVKHQDLASALAIDVVSMQEHLQSGGEFVLEIENVPVEIFPSEKAWQDQFYAGERYPGGFVEALARKPAMATLYAALSNMEPSSAALLVRSVGMKPLAEKYSPLLTLYSSCLQIAAGRVEVPGGSSASPIWATLAHAQPTDPRRFLRELLDRDDGRLLKFYFLISQTGLSQAAFFHRQFEAHHGVL